MPQRIRASSSLRYVGGRDEETAKTISQERQLSTEVQYTKGKSYILSTEDICQIANGVDVRTITAKWI